MGYLSTFLGSSDGDVSVGASLREKRTLQYVLRNWNTLSTCKTKDVAF